MNNFDDVLNKINGYNRLEAENMELKRQLEESQKKQPPIIESGIVQAFRQSPEYLALEMQAFNAFLQEKFIGEFQKSKQAEQFIKAAQEQFKEFEENYNKKSGGTENGKNGTKKSGGNVKETDHGADSEA